jgi:phage FluMu protein Com
MSDIKCVSCGKKIGEASIQQGELRIKCKCGTVNVVKAETEKQESFTDRVSKSLEKK